jgi:hypothetical protein
MNKHLKTIIGLVALLVVSSCATIGSSSQSSTPSSSSAPSSSHVPGGDDHDFEVLGTTSATIIENGKITYKCSVCDYTKTEDYLYALDQCAFVNQTFVYDGKPHTLMVQGLIPTAVTIEYENNVLTEIGQKQAKAYYYDPDHKLLKEEKAFIKVTPNDGFPNIYVNTRGIEIDEEDKESYTPMALTVSNCPEQYILNGVEGGIRVRGNGSLTYEKKGYRIKFDDKRIMLGLNDEAKAKSWVLLAEYSDQSMLRNSAAFYLGGALLNYSNNYASSYQHINLYINNEYKGVYLLAEQQQANKQRIDVKEPEDNYKGTDVGYLLELDNYANQEDNYFSAGSFLNTLNGVILWPKDYTIKSDIFDRAQKEYIEKYIKNVYSIFFSAIAENKFFILDKNLELITSPYLTAFDTLNSLIDMESLFKMYLLHEVMKNIDVGYSSFFMFVDFSKDSKYPRLTFGAPWDFDWSSGNVDVETASSPDGNFGSTAYDAFKFNPWFYMLANASFFNETMTKYYRVFDHSNVINKLLANLTYETNAFVTEFDRNYHRWANLGTIVPKFTPKIATTFKTHKDAANHLIDWLTDRKAYLDSVYLV